MEGADRSRAEHTTVQADCLTPAAPHGCKALPPTTSQHPRTHPTTSQLLQSGPPDCTFQHPRTPRIIAIATKRACRLHGRVEASRGT
eukprot:354470-Chlamydomonas_euryale.AAC.11